MGIGCLSEMFLGGMYHSLNMIILYLIATIKELRGKQIILLLDQTLIDTCMTYKCIHLLKLEARAREA